MTKSRSSKLTIGGRHFKHTNSRDEITINKGSNFPSHSLWLHLFITWLLLLRIRTCPDTFLTSSGLQMLPIHKELYTGCSGKIVFFPQFTATPPSPTSLRETFKALDAMRVNSHSYWLVIFLYNQQKPSAGKEVKKAQYLMNTLYIHSLP